MKMPPEYLDPALQSIESVIVGIHEEFPRLVDTDVEWVCEKLLNYYKIHPKGKEAEEPLSPSDMKQALIDELLNIIDARIEGNADDFIINNPNYRHGENLYPSLDYLYAVCLKRVRDSARFWRKRNGKQGYLNYVRHFIKRQ